jgi:hypothetical protein
MHCQAGCPAVDRENSSSCPCPMSRKMNLSQSGRNLLHFGTSSSPSWWLHQTTGSSSCLAFLANGSSVTVVSWCLLILALNATCSEVCCESGEADVLSSVAWSSDGCSCTTFCVWFLTLNILFNHFVKPGIWKPRIENDKIRTLILYRFWVTHLQGVNFMLSSELYVCRFGRTIALFNHHIPIMEFSSLFLTWKSGLIGLQSRNEQAWKCLDIYLLIALSARWLSV